MQPRQETLEGEFDLTAALAAVDEAGVDQGEHGRRVIQHDRNELGALPPI